MVVDGAGVTVIDRCGTQTRAWAMLSGFVETKHLFVVLNRSGSCLLILANCGTADPDALRARHAAPVGRPAPAGPALEVRA
ncbi:hypothetical protein F7Q99_29995 [Streptomyces kaniharaensis]|uniref:Uncharacterized protein n=1 Tax=Streptomyces kaniharaensis TaxID=212423 RepID=A0A6N7KXW0_9ACTN|nr:YcxB family protein [Streptomyces kaniharaensis]MQS16331.1 hypothetical protein [Streptomyces kaniharaensis]